jgi:hypothetical protein
MKTLCLMLVCLVLFCAVIPLDHSILAAQPNQDALAREAIHRAIEASSAYGQAFKRVPSKSTVRAVVEELPPEQRQLASLYNSPELRSLPFRPFDQEVIQKLLESGPDSDRQEVADRVRETEQLVRDAASPNAPVAMRQRAQLAVLRLAVNQEADLARMNNTDTKRFLLVVRLMDAETPVIDATAEYSSKEQPRDEDFIPFKEWRSTPISYDERLGGILHVRFKRGERYSSIQTISVGSSPYAVRRYDVRDIFR